MTTDTIDATTAAIEAHQAHERAVAEHGRHSDEAEQAFSAVIETAETGLWAVIDRSIEACGRTLTKLEREALGTMVTSVWDEAGAEWSDDPEGRRFVLGLVERMAREYGGDPGFTVPLAAWKLETCLTEAICDPDGPTVSAAQQAVRVLTPLVRSSRNATYAREVLGL
jgi:hypothetical protein